MKKLGKKKHEIIETIEAYMCSCSGIGVCNCSGTNTNYYYTNQDVYAAVDARQYNK